MSKLEGIIDLIEQGIECEYLDFKAKTYSKDKNEDLIKDVLAMANAKNGENKYIIFGIKDSPNKSRQILGINPDEVPDASNYQQLILSNIEPDINLNFFTLLYEDKTIGVIELFSNNNKPYVIKKNYRNLNEGLCMIRKGSQNSFAKRTDYDEFYLTKRKPPIFKVPNHSERELVVENDILKSVIKDGPLLRNIGKSPAFNVNINMFLDVIITQQEFFLAGEIPEMGEISLSYLDDVILSWRNEITKVENSRYASIISHECKLLIEFEDENGVKYSQALIAGISWGQWTEKYKINIGGSDDFTEPIRQKKELQNTLLVSEMINYWKELIQNENFESIQKIDEQARELAWEIYKSGYSDASYRVNELFSTCQNAQEIGRAIYASREVNRISKESNKKCVSDENFYKSLGNWLIDGANASRRLPFNNHERESYFWENFSMLSQRLGKSDGWFFTKD